MSLNIPGIRERSEFAYAYIGEGPCQRDEHKRLPPDLVQHFTGDVPQLIAEVRRLRDEVDRGQEMLRRAAEERPRMPGKAGS